MISLILSALLAQQINLPPEIHGMPGAFISIPSATDGKQVQWVVLDKGLNLFPVELLKDSKTCVVTTTIEGRYRVLAYTAAGDNPSKPAITLVIIGSPPAPEPEPDNPEEASKLSREIRSIYRALNEDDKQGKALKLAAVYKGLVAVAKDPAIETTGDLLGAAKIAANKVLAPTDLKEIRDKLSQQFVGFPDDPSVIITAEMRVKFAVVFKDISKAIEIAIK
jgi:hypothetical protein